ncbi:unnamed protein product [Kuraishia capsulata CBS 1993]|uniref:Zn(2)-C6 fungal-type domain-containing protein n=1 Tax=Kuraishia capsulata CBS 1993 TaxID=1382522 RepID=W6MKI1_9ASCO|nr:uncharacterized protein KUCA_T00001184001 [Kuraishia capsulata CBS 1993]CDK25217.1 unnamed protein product [Kuraishia capsulata CBS 1993]
MKVERRVKSGCFTCRSRKKKCDESGPVCRNCLKGSFECVWPQRRNQTLPHTSFKVKKIKNNKTVFICVSMEDEKTVTRKRYDLAISCRNDPGPTSRLYSIPGVILDSESAMLLKAFMQGFVPSITPQFTLPIITPGGIAIPLLPISSAFREVCFACGASYLAWKNASMVELAQKRYQRSMKTLFDEIKHQNVDGSEDWLVYSMLILSLREKYFGASNAKCTHHLIAAYQMMLKRRHERLNGNSQHDHSLSQFDKMKFEQYLTHPSTEMDANEFLVYDLVDEGSGETRKQVAFTAQDKYMVDSFAYNYSVELLLCTEQALGKFPSPFDFFDDFRDIMTTPVFDLPVEWMNNPILGAAREGFEVCAKASWIARKHGNHRHEAELLYHITAHETVGDLPMECNQLQERDITHLKCSLLTRMILMKAAHLLLRKVLFADIATDDPIIQNDVETILTHLALIPNYHPICSIIPWPIMIAGSAALHENQRQFIRKRTSEIGDYVHTHYSYQMLEFFEKAWGNQGVPGMGCDILLDRPSLEKLCI